MGQVLHSSATTTHIVRAAIQRLQASLQGRRSVWRALTSEAGQNRKSAEAVGMSGVGGRDAMRLKDAASDLNFWRLKVRV